MTTINLSDPYVQSYTMTVQEAREFVEADPDHVAGDLIEMLDIAQGSVHGKDTPKAFIVIEIIPDSTEEPNPAA